MSRPLLTAFLFRDRFPISCLSASTDSLPRQIFQSEVLASYVLAVLNFRHKVL